MTAACVHAEGLRRRGESGREAYQLADAFCEQSRQRVSDLFHHLWHNTDAVDRTVVRDVLAGRYTWLESGVVDPSTPGPWIADATPGPSELPDVRRPIP
jgi:hypothetical protein